MKQRFDTSERCLCVLAILPRKIQTHGGVICPGQLPVLTAHCARCGGYSCAHKWHHVRVGVQTSLNFVNACLCESNMFFGMLVRLPSAFSIRDEGNVFSNFALRFGQFVSCPAGLADSVNPRPTIQFFFFRCARSRSPTRLIFGRRV